MATWKDDLRVGDELNHGLYGPYIVSYINGSRDVGVTFTNTGAALTGLQKGNVARGAVKDYLFRSVEGVGYAGSQDVHPRGYVNAWHKMHTRCYSSNWHKKRPTYIGCSVDKSWHNLSVFSKWCEVNYIEGYHLDKDLLVEGNKVYSAETCCFIPPLVNAAISETITNRDGMMTGVSKRKKKGTQLFNGLYNVQLCGVNLARTKDLQEANSIALEFKKFYWEELADKQYSIGAINKQQRDALCTRSPQHKRNV